MQDIFFVVTTVQARRSKKRVSIPSRDKRCISSLNLSNRPWGSPTSYSTSNNVISPGTRRTERQAYHPASPIVAVDEWSPYLNSPPYAFTARIGTIQPFPRSHNLGANKSSNQKLHKGEQTHPIATPTHLINPLWLFTRFTKVTDEKAHRHGKFNDFRVSAIGANALSVSLLYTIVMWNVCFRSGLMGVFRLPASAFGLTIMINSRTKLSSLLVGRVLGIPELQVARDALSVGVSFRRHLVQLVLINNKGLFHSVTC